jgi:hypothetical protein
VEVWGNCVGILALHSNGAAPWDLPAGNYQITDNHVWANDKACPASQGPPLSGIGIALVGVHDTRVTNNEVSINRPSGPSPVSGGIVMLSPPEQPGVIPKNNTIRDNMLHNNSPFDLFSDGSGTGNRFLDNECATSQPPGLCG